MHWNLHELKKQQLDTVNYLERHFYSRDNVLNGIAYNFERGTFFLTGKRWDFIWEVKLNEF